MTSTLAFSLASRRAARGVATLVVALLALAGSAQAAPRPAPEATWMANGNVYAVARAGGLVYLAGDFTALTDAAGLRAPANASSGPPLPSPGGPGTRGRQRRARLPDGTPFNLGLSARFPDLGSRRSTHCPHAAGGRGSGA